MPPVSTEYRLLIVDDEKSILRGLELSIGRSFPIFTASSGQEGLEVFKSKGPFPIVISDFIMPKMNGAVFLEEIRKLDSGVVTMLLTGGANFDQIADAVCRGQIFRLLSKPCEKENLIENIKQGIKQYELMRVEKDLLDQTLKGAIDGMSTILAAAKPLLFGRSQRVKEISTNLAKEVGILGDWRMELAITFSYLGYLTLPDEVIEKIYNNEEQSGEVSKLIGELPLLANKVLEGIPRLEEISQIISLISRDYKEVVNDTQNMRQIASIIRLSQDYERMVTDGHSKTNIFDYLGNQPTRYWQSGLDALIKSNQLSSEVSKIDRVSPERLEPGMRICQDLRLPNNMLVAPRGTVVDRHFVKTIENYVITYLGSPFPPRIEVLVKTL